MATNNLKGTDDSFDDNSKDSQTNLGSVQHDSTVHINGAINAKTGGQMNGGVVINTGDRKQAENESPEGA
ncbi:MAG TPA: hypothetical protein VK835_04110 [Bacteroidia bacterium]|jgi:formylmethanofuran dehydrogenase subunit C|nr:hypothetical protein [Bacteroidia bacterium]